MKKTRLITGCSSGLGQQLAARVLARGDELIATARNPETLRDLVQRFPETVRVCMLDVTRPETAQTAVALAVDAFGGLDVLVNNAGYGMFGAIEEAEPDEYRPMFEVNVFGLIEVTRAALPVLRQRAGGRAYRQSIFDGRNCRIRGFGLLRRHQVRCRRFVGGAGRGSAAPRVACHHCRARPVPDCVSGTLGRLGQAPDQRL